MRTLPILLIVTASAALLGQAAATGPVLDHRLAETHSKDHPYLFAADYATRAAWEARAEFLRDQVLVAQGLWPMPPKVDLHPVIHSPIDRDEYTIEKVIFTSLPGHYVTGNLYRPKAKPAGGGKYPAVLVPYGHWPNGRFMWKSDADAQKEITNGAEKNLDAARSPLQATCAMLARMGCIAFQWDLVGYCDSTFQPATKTFQIPHQQGFLDVDAELHLQSFHTLQTWNAVRALDFVASLPEVDPARIAVTGASSGGTQTIQLSAVDRDRLAACFPAVMVSMNMQGGCVCENTSLLRVGSNNVELATLFAPKPQAAAAAQDWTVDFETRGLPEMKHIYGLYDAADNISGKFFPFPHNVNLSSREMMYNFMNRSLKLGLADPMTEKPFVPVPVAELSVWDKDHAPPADSADAKGVRAWLTKSSDQTLGEIRKNPAQWHKLLSVALQSMVVDALPAAEEVVATAGAPDAGRVSGTLSRKGAGERVPFAFQQAEGNGQTVVIWVDTRGAAVLGDSKAPPIAEVATVLKTGASVLAITPFMSGTFSSKGPTTNPAQGRPAPFNTYGGYTDGYERTVLANRVHDLLTAMAYVQTLRAPGTSGHYKIRMVATAGAGPQALLAAALGGNAVERLALDLGGFDFDQLQSATDQNMLPGALKYGGIYAFAGLLAGDKNRALITGARDSANRSLAKDLPGVALETAARPAADLAAWVIGTP